MHRKKKVCVVGSMNMDLMVTADRVPEQGETILGDSFAMSPGGKGANQAVAAARLGADVEMIGAVGDDSFGHVLLSALKEEGIHTEAVQFLAGIATGTATIILSGSDNRIIVAPGANKQVSPELVQAQKEKIADSSILLLQLELPVETVAAAADIARQNDVPIILNPAPYQELPESLLRSAAFLTPNMVENAAMQESSLYSFIKEKLILTKGKQGAAFYEKGEVTTIPSHEVDVKDTTGAGDTFNGALAAQLSDGRSVIEAVTAANAAAALSVKKAGAQAGMPTLSELEQFLDGK
ncbi:ribokinase [Virgibacillus xinjiangensis]|uniref:Ribokinase n=1 Tax=Virgibacillus xinjiangensis TaxID=393090 RepID=A0ABV7CQK9_9BACI